MAVEKCFPEGITSSLYESLSLTGGGGEVFPFSGLVKCSLLVERKSVHRNGRGGKVFIRMGGVFLDVVGSLKPIPSTRSLLFPPPSLNRSYFLDWIGN